MRFIMFWEYCLEDTDKAIEKFRQMTAEREKFSEKYPKLIFGPYGIGGESKGFTVYETDDVEKLTNISIHYVPVLKCKFLPIHESSRASELYLKSKK